MHIHSRLNFSDASQHRGKLVQFPVGLCHSTEPYALPSGIFIPRPRIATKVRATAGVRKTL